MVRFIHTGDWQFGMKARDVAAKGGDIRKVRLETLGRIGQLAAERHAEFVLLAGDVFEDNQVDTQLVHDVLRQLERFTCPVYLLPGNHDHAGPGSVYARPAFERRPANVHLLLEAVPVVVGSAVLLAAPLFTRTSSADPTAILAALETSPGVIRIGVGHGSLMIEGKYKPDDFPIALDAAARARLDYLALGHWHSYYQHDDRTVYSGTPEQTKFGERDSGTAAIVEIDAAGAIPRIERISVGHLVWEQWEGTGEPRLLERWRSQLEALPDPGRVLLRWLPRGRVPAEFMGQLEELASWARSRLYYLDVRAEGLSPAIAGGALAERCASHPLLEGLVADVAGALQLLDPTGAEDPRVPVLVDREALRRRLAEVEGDVALVREAALVLSELVWDATA